MRIRKTKPSSYSRNGDLPKTPPFTADYDSSNRIDQRRIKNVDILELLALCVAGGASDLYL